MSNNLDRLEQELGRYSDASAEDFRARVNEALGIGDIYWEYGPDFDGDKMAFSVSLENDHTEIEALSRKFGFPTCSEKTNFRIGIPPRRWEGEFILVGEDGERIEVKTGSWLFSFDKNSRLSVFLDASVREDYQEYAIRVFLTGELGERNCGLIAASPVKSTDIGRTYVRKSQLREEFANLYPNCEYRKEFAK